MTGISGLGAPTLVPNDLFRLRATARAAGGGAPNSSASGGGDGSAPPGAPAAERDLTDQQRAQIQQLRSTDAKVRAHEQAHKTAGGAYAGPIQLQYTTGPDGRQYAVAGEVSIDASPIEGDPQASIAKLNQVKQAALAPGDPSPQDRAVASQADAAIAAARQELAAQRNAEAKERQGGGNSEAAPDAASNAQSGGQEQGFRRATDSYTRAAQTIQAAAQSERGDGLNLFA